MILAFLLHAFVDYWDTKVATQGSLDKDRQLMYVFIDVFCLKGNNDENAFIVMNTCICPIKLFFI